MTDAPNMIFVFGSNLAGRHGAGAARQALKMYGAVYGHGVGLQGRSYAIPTKDANLRTLPLGTVATYIVEFLRFADKHPELLFYVTPIGTGLAGFAADQIKPFFIGAPSNCLLPEQFSMEW